MANDIGNLSPQNVFQHGGRYYSFNAVIANPMLKDGFFILNNNNVEEFQYVNEINTLLITGKMTYTDEAGQIGKILGFPYSLLKVAINQKRRNDDNGIAMLEDVEAENQKFVHEFAIKNYKILGRKQEKITYELELVSRYWYKFIADVFYSNYDAKKGDIRKNPYEIIKELLTSINVPIDVKSFEKVINLTKDKLFLDYATKDGDTVQTAIDYVLCHTMYDKVQDEWLKFIIFDPNVNLFKLVDIKDLTTFKAVSQPSGFLSLFKSNFEQMLLNRDAGLGTLVKKSVLDAQKSLFDTSLWNYDIYSNNFNNENSQTTQESLLRRQNSRDKMMVGQIEKLGVIDKFQELDQRFFTPSETGLWKYHHETTKWDNDYWLYKEFIENFIHNNGLILSIDGNVVHTAGTGFTITLDNMLQFADFEDSEEKEELRIKLAQFNGFYFIARSRHKICPKYDTGVQPSYTENLVLVRNFALDPK